MMPDEQRVAALEAEGLTHSDAIAAAMGEYVCKHSPSHGTHLHEDNGPDNRYDCDPECEVPDEDWEMESV